MHLSIMGFVEFFFALLFGLGWLVLEYVGRRLDAKRKAPPPDQPKAPV